MEFVFSFEELLYASRSLWVAEGRVRDTHWRMKIVIGLNQADFVCLRDKIPDDSSLRQVFKPWQNDDNESGYDEFKQTGPGIPLTAEIQIHCSKEEGEQLLAFAKKHCPSAVPPVNAALAGRTI